MRVYTANNVLSPLIQSPGSRRLLAAAAVLGLTVWGAGVASGANVLANPNLDTIAIQDQINATPVNWVVEGSKTTDGAFFDGGDSEPWCNVIDTGGYGFFFKPFQGLLGPPSNLLNVYLYQDNSTTPNTKFTLSGYAAGEANFCALFNTNAPAPKALWVIEFLDNTSTIIASNAFDLVANGLPTGGPGSMSGFNYTTPQVTAPAGTVTVRAGAWLLNAYGTTGAQSFFVDGFDLEAFPPPGSPVITNQPVANTIVPGGTAHLTVGVSNTAGVSYQWQLGGVNLSDTGNVSGSSTAALTITNFSAANVGHYRVLVSNGAGAVYSSDAPLAMQSLNIFPVISLTGKIGDTYRVDYSTTVAPTTWIPLATNRLTTAPQVFTDNTAPLGNQRFYRSVFLY